jgi:meso-butanediol dehydrogenase / (S,S)-butanediol dehydrogenase / diacetyl reductase
MYDLSGKVALVTGAGGEHGIGRAIATRLAREGADVAVNDVAERPYADGAIGWGGIASVVREIEALGRRSRAIVADVSDAKQVERMVGQTLDELGSIDILVCNAGSRPGRDRVSILELDEDAFDTVQRVNVKGTFLCCRSVARAMVARDKGGKIIIMSSTAGKRGVARNTAYCASKFALVGFTQALALDLAPWSICVNAICPGLVDTERVGYIASAIAPAGVSAAAAREQHVLRSAADVPLGRIAHASDVARMAAFLASAESDYLTGLAIDVAGGAVMD